MVAVGNQWCKKFNFGYFDWNLFKILPNVVDLRHCFEKVHFTNMIPFNVFQRRMVENNNVTKYIKDSDIPVKLKTYKYR